jgi:hypothetical protein
MKGAQSLIAASNLPQREMFVDHLNDIGSTQDFG